MKCNQRKINFVSCFAACIAALSAQAQEHAPFQYGHKQIMLAEDQLQQQFYGLAAASASRHLYQQEQAGIPYQWQDDALKAQYIQAIGGIKTMTEAAVEKAILLIEQTTAQPLRDRLHLAIAQYYFINGQLATAIPYYEQAGISNLSNTEIADAKFELAYCYFNNNQLEKADPLFAVMKEVQGKYYSPGNYYFGLLAYNRGAYTDALKAFDRIDEEPRYRAVVPYYMAELQYFLGNRQKALNDALRLIKRTEQSYYHNELHLLAAQCLFEEKRYGDALPYFEYYYERTEKIRKEELYEMGFCYYQVNEWKNAIDKFKPLSSAKDSLGQTAMYLLGDCYLKTADKRSARSAFGFCANMAFNQGQRKAALLLYAKLSYELGYNDDALRSLDRMVAEFGGGQDAYLLQSQLFAATSNYKGAYESLLLSDASNEVYRQTMQRVSYSYALQQLQQQNLDVADSLFNTALRYNKQPAFTAATNFWKGELAYRQHRNSEALQYSQNFLALNGTANASSVSSEATPAHAYLNMGYASLELADYAKAREYFNKAGSGSSREVAANAGLREADAAFMQQDYNRAAALYGKAGTGTGRDADYARLQQAIVYGLQGKNADKTRILQSLLNTSPPSAYANDARYELAIVEMTGNRYQQAISLLQPLTVNKELKQLAPKALLKMGTAYQQMDNDEKAIEAYRRILADYSTAPERTDAQAALKSIYIERNQPDVYAALLIENNLQPQEDNELDASYYSAAEAQYAAEKWPAAQEAFGRYLQQYPNGMAALKAHYYRAESIYQQKKYKEALPEYDAVLTAGWSDFSEPSARRAAEISFTSGDFTAAAGYYHQLRNNALGNSNLVLAYTGLMRSAAGNKNTPEAAAYADTLLTLADVPLTTIDEAKLHQAHQLQAAGNTAAASAIFQGLQASKNNAIAAEARYYGVETLLQNGKLKEAEEAASKNIKLSAGNEYWVVKTYILLGDILVKEKDYFNAKATLQSVVQNTKIETLKSEAARKLEEIKTMESSKLSND
jgi:tetratricopeptide (TPR) repeat protein